MKSRSRSVIKNTIWEMGYYIVVIALGFLAPRYIILYYSSEVNGLTSTVQHIINIILMLQAGASTAAVFSLYKPIAENNYDEICKNINSAIAFFKRISYIFGGIMMVVAIVTPFVLKTKLDKIFVFLAMVIMGAKSFTDLYFTAKFRIIFTAYQQKYFISIATLIEQAVYYGLVFLTILLRWHYIWMYIWFLLGCIVKIVCLELMLKKSHPDLIHVRGKGKSDGIGGRNYALANELSHSLMSSSITIMMSFMYGLAEASVYSIYALVNEALNLISTSLYSSFGPGFGDLFAQDNKEHSAKVFSTFQYIFVMFSTFLMMCMLFAVVPFVQIYTSGAKDINYVNYALATIMAVGGVFSAYRIPYNIVVSSCGFFKETWLQPVVSVFLCIGLALGFGSIEYTYVLIGSMVFFAINFLYQHFRLKELVPYMISHRVFILFLISAIGIVLTVFVNLHFRFPKGTFAWAGCTVIYALITIAYIVLMSMIFTRDEFRDAIDYVRALLHLKRG